MATLSEAPKTATPATRVEEDLLGQRHVPADAYYGIHTLRAVETSTSLTLRSLTCLNLYAA